MEPFLDDSWDGLGFERSGDAYLDSVSSASGLNSWGGRPISDIWGLGISGRAGGFIMS